MPKRTTFALPAHRATVLRRTGFVMGTYELPRRLALGTMEWKRARQRCLERDGYTCQACGAPATVGGHRIAPEAGGPNYELANLVALCRACNISQGSQDFDYWMSLPYGRPARIRTAKLRPFRQRTVKRQQLPAISGDYSRAS